MNDRVGKRQQRKCWRRKLQVVVLVVVVPAEIGLQATDAEGEEVVVRLIIRAPVAHDHCWKSGLQAMSLCGSPVVIVRRLLRVEVVDPKVVVDLAVLTNVGAVARGVEEGLPIPAASAAQRCSAQATGVLAREGRGLGVTC